MRLPAPLGQFRAVVAIKYDLIHPDLDRRQWVVGPRQIIHPRNMHSVPVNQLADLKADDGSNLRDKPIL